MTNIQNKLYQLDKLPVEGIIEWDVLNWSELISLWTPYVQQIPKNAKVLAIGERGGGLSLWLALLGYNVVCTDVVDISNKAAVLHKNYNVADKIIYKQLDIVNDSLVEEYDLIIAKSVLGGVKEKRDDANTRNFTVQQKVVANIYNMLKPDGIFLSAENLQGNIFTKLIRRYSGKLKGWEYINFNKLPELFAAYNILQIKTFGILPSSFSNRVLNNWAFSLNKKIFSWLPDNTKYIAFIVAQKSS